MIRNTNKKMTEKKSHKKKLNPIVEEYRRVNSKPK